jgi:hypothetical protein
MVNERERLNELLVQQQRGGKANLPVMLSHLDLLESLMKGKNSSIKGMVIHGQDPTHWDSTTQVLI